MNYKLLYYIAENTAGIPPAVGDGIHALAYKIAQNTAGTPPVVGDSIYDLLYKITKNTAGIPPEVGDAPHDLLSKIAENTGSSPTVGDGMSNLLYKIGRNTTDGGGISDPDARDFFARASITDSAQQIAINDLVLALKAAGVWGKMRALYPFVGGTAASHSENLKASIYRMLWNGISLTHNANGVTGGGADGYGLTGLNVNTTTLGSIAFGVYQRSAVMDNNRDIATTAGGAATEYAIYSSFGGTFYGVAGAAGNISASMPDPRGFFILSRQSASVYKAYNNAIQIGSTGTGASEPLPDLEFRVLLNANPRNLALAFISDGLSDAEVTALNTAVQAYQTALGRKV